jgi:hypothetical protein
LLQLKRIAGGTIWSEVEEDGYPNGPKIEKGLAGHVIIFL